ncbi:MAG: UDP-N-acetylglucosamine 1-carboxyvinyltransferase, partial [Nitrospirae bacterium]
LAEGETVLRNVPRVRDVDVMLELLAALGAKARWDGGEPGTVRILGGRVGRPEAPYELVRRMRASFMVLGPLVARYGCGRVSEPGGCAIGVRPVDQHLRGLEALGAKVARDGGYVEMSARRLRGTRFRFDVTTVNGTQNVMMAATLAEGETVLENAALEPEVVELARVLRAMGAEIEGEGTSTLRIRGVERLQPVDHTASGDRIEAGTLLVAGAITGGEVEVTGVDPRTLGATLDRLRETGAELRVGEDRVAIRAPARPRGIRVVTAPYPGFATDMQAQIMALLCVAEGSSVVTETVFENRFMHVPELRRMGADISLAGRSAHVRGVPRLSGAPVRGADLGAAASLILAGLAAEGETRVNRVYHIDRGYERIEAKLAGLGARIRRESG